MKSNSKLASVIAVALLLAGCSALPSAGPSHTAILSDATVHVARPGDAINYALVDITQSILPFFNQTFSFLGDGFASQQSSPGPTMFGVGDVVEVTIFESQAGGLFIPRGGIVPGNFITLPAQTIDETGTITVPYVGTVKVLHRSVTDVQTEIENDLANKAIEPQVIITTTNSRSTRVSVLGDVNAPAELDVSPAGERILDAISRAGGLNAPGEETYVTLARGKNRTTTTLFQSIVADPRQNIYVKPGDVIYVSRERRTYVAFGAQGLNGRFNFDESDLTLGEALAKAGGLVDSRADPSQVFLYRVVDRDTLVAAGIDVSKLYGDHIPVIFRADLRDPGTFFATQQFRMQDKDVIYVSNSTYADIAKFLILVNGISNTTASVPASIVVAKESIQALNK